MEDSLLLNPDFEFMRPLVTSWVNKIERADSSRKEWKELADECMMYYSKSAAAMWDEKYSRKIWQGVKPPKFRISINKAFEYVAVMAPNLFWGMPHRSVKPKSRLEVPAGIIPDDPMFQQAFAAMMQQQQMSEQRDAGVSMMLESWLNYTSREQPNGGLKHESWLSLIDALLKGRGVMVSRPYQMPGSGKMLTGSFREKPENLFIDSDFTSLDDAMWIAIKHTEKHWAVEEKFNLPRNSLKGRSSLESSWHGSEINTTEGGVASHRVNGDTNDMIVWYEIYSKGGPGARMTGMPNSLKDHLEDVVGKYAYVAISPSVPYPLNCPAEAFRSGGINNKGATDRQIKEKFSWPAPLWADDRWPIECLDFYPDPDKAWPVPPLAPAMGELKFLNFMVPWLANRIYSSSRDFIAIASKQFEEYKRHFQEGDDQTLIPMPPGTDDIRKQIMVLQQPETRLDAWKIVGLVHEYFDKRTGLTETAYGRNENGTQNRTAEETLAKSKAVGARPEFMQNQLIDHQSRLAATEAFLARWFIEGDDVGNLMGPVGKFMWENFVMTSDIESVVRQMNYTVSASSVRRPDRDRDVANFQQVMQYFAPAMEGVMNNWGDPKPYNAMMKKWGEYHDEDLQEMEIQPPPPPQPDPKQEMDMQLKQMDMQSKQMDMQARQMDHAAKLEQLGAKAEADAMKLQAEITSAQLQFQFDAIRSEQEVDQDEVRHDQEIRQSEEKFDQEMAHSHLEGLIKLNQMEEMHEAKVEATKKQSSKEPTQPEK